MSWVLKAHITQVFYRLQIPDALFQIVDVTIDLLFRSVMGLVYWPRRRPLSRAFKVTSLFIRNFFQFFWVCK